MQMDLLSKGRFVFRDITNRLNVRQITPCNEVENKKEETSRKQDAHSPITLAIPAEPTASVSVKHETGNSQPAKLSNEQREERNRKERKYRKRKRDEMNNVDISVLSNTPMQLLTISSSMQSDGGNICRDEKFEKQREDRNRKQREYRASKKAESNNVILANFDATTPIIDGVTQEETIHVQDAKVHIPDDTYVEFDSGLFEPPLIDFVHEGEL
uniref:Uncharacterized protein n=1 Tax=Oryza rufipogon TaxID=4529 RepID=A0A0E0P511_ORYRU